MIEMMRKLFFKRKMAYRALFLQDNELTGPAARIVLSDLRKFCRADRSSVQVSHLTGQADPFATAVAEGRREVWNRIIHHLHVDDRVMANLNDSEE